MTKNQIAMRNIARGTDGQTAYRTLGSPTVSGRGALTPKNRRRLDRDPADVRKKWAALDERRVSRNAHNRADRERREAAEAARAKKGA